MDPAETRIFIGSVGGQIRVVDILTEVKGARQIKLFQKKR
jgi:hypothetical protein